MLTVPSASAADSVFSPEINCTSTARASVTIGAPEAIAARVMAHYRVLHLDQEALVGVAEPHPELQRVCARPWGR